MRGNRVFTIVVDQTKSGDRFDTVAATCISGCTRSRLVHLIKDGHIQVNGGVKKPGYRVKPGDVIKGYIPPPEPLRCFPESIPLDVVYADPHLIIVNKPPGLVVHPAPGHRSGTLVNALLYHFPELKLAEGDLRPGIVHRLDKDTSGLLIIAKHIESREFLMKQFLHRTITKTYWAIVHGEPALDSGLITLSIGRDPRDRKRMSTLGRRGREAETAWSVLERFDGITLLEIDLKTGRTHQIRVHLASMHHPIIGDPVYGPRKGIKCLFDRIDHVADGGLNQSEPWQRIGSIHRQMLHARRIEFVHPASGKSMSFTASLPEDMSGLLDVLIGRRLSGPGCSTDGSSSNTGSIRMPHPSR